MIQQKAARGLCAPFSGGEFFLRFALALLLCGAVGLGVAESAAATGFEDGLQYHSPETCTDLGGHLQEVSGEQVCSGIDKSGTFCIVGSRDAFPCRGMFKHVGRCNGKYNRPAENPFICAPVCGSGTFACGSECISGGIAPPARIPFAAPGYSGHIFNATLTMSAGKGQMWASADSALTIWPLGTATWVGFYPSAPRVSEQAVTLHAAFSCAGAEQNFGAVDFAFTVTTLPPFPIFRVTREHLASVRLATLTLAGLSDFDFTPVSGIDLNSGFNIYINKRGDVSSGGGTPETNLYTIIANATSPGGEFLGVISVTVVITTAGPPNAARVPSSCRTPEYYTATRSANGCAWYSACNLDTQLAAAIADGDMTTACSLITMGANVGHTPSGLAPKPVLINAVQRWDAEMVSILAYNGADVNRRFVFRELISNTPLHELAAHPVTSTLGRAVEQIARALVENGADVNAKNARGSTYLYLVAVGGHAGGMRVVLQAGADPNLPIVEERLLVNEDEEIYTHRSAAEYALVRASDNNHIAAVSVLLEFKEQTNLNVDIMEEARGLGALHVAESAEVVKLLLDAGANPNLESAPQSSGHASGLSPLDWMARQGTYPEAAEYLHQRGGICLNPEDDLDFCDW